MQYALQKMGDNKYILIDAAESQAVIEHGDTIMDAVQPSDEVFELVYGAYLPQHGVPTEKALADANNARGFWMGTVLGSTCHLVGLEDVVFYPAVHVGHATRIPFAALICVGNEALAEIRTESARALTCFTRYSQQMTPATNVLNRPGIFAIKSHAKRSSGKLTKENWQSQIEVDRVHRSAAKVR